MENKLRGMLSGSQLLLVEKGVGLFSTILRYEDGTEKQLPATTPAKDLIAVTEIDYRGYRREIKRLREEHPLFTARLDIPVADFEDFVAETLLLPSMLQKTEPVSFFVLGALLDQVLQREDDGSALFLLNAAEELLYVLEDPIRTQICLRNILEMAFDADTHYPEMMQILDLGAAEPKRELYTADDFRREDQKGRQSLREQYGKRYGRDAE